MINIDSPENNKKGYTKQDLFMENKGDDNDDESIMLRDHTYPSPNDKDFQHAIYIKRDFNKYVIPQRGKLDNYKTIKKYRDAVCSGKVKLREHQSMLSNFINPRTPYRGLLLFHGTGSGKSCATVAIAEKFKPMVEKYHTKIHVLVPGPLHKQNFLSEIIKCTGNKYLQSYHENPVIMTEAEKARVTKNAMIQVNQYYYVLSHRSFYRKVLGEKIFDKDAAESKFKKTFRKNESGEYERDLSVDRIYSLDNTLLIVDEAHRITDNEYGNAVKKIIEVSKNLKIVLLTATPMKNLADDIVPLLNYLRPQNHKIERDKIFNSQHNHTMGFKTDGKEYLRNMCRGYVSYLRGADPLTFAERVDMGEIPPGLSFTKVIRCKMLPFQLEAYKKITETHDDSLDRRSGAIANFAIPGLSKQRGEKNIVGYCGIDGINEVRSQLKNNAKNLTETIASTILAKNDIKDPMSLLYVTESNKTLGGDIFNERYLKYFSIKFYTALQNINDTVYGKEGTGLSFVYSDLVRVGVDLFQEVLQKNGYLEYTDNSTNYNIKNDTKCYFCGNVYKQHQKKSENIPDHKFHPATYVAITGKTDDTAENIPEEKMKILKNVFNNASNKDGKYIKIVLGSQVMNEGITLHNITKIHILDVHYNLARVDQAIGRGIRFCKHYDISNEMNPFPQVKIYKYVVSVNDGLSSEEDLYRKAEQKYILIKETERILEEEAIDCPLNRNGNIFQQELEKYKDCGTVDNQCPAICGYMTCDFKCGSQLLNAKYYDPEKNIYKKVSRSEMDYTTYDNTLASEEIEDAKSIIKKMYKFKNIYLLDDIIATVKATYPEHKLDMFDDYYVYQALDELVPITGNDFNNFKDIINDKYDRIGYLIYRARYYIFQPFDENEDVPMYYRDIFNIDLKNDLSIKDYMVGTDEYGKYKGKTPLITDGVKKDSYDFETVQEYYDGRDEFDYVGSIDRESTRKKSNVLDAPQDEFKIRAKRPKILQKKRETGVPSFKGSVCTTSKDKKLLLDISKKMNIELEGQLIRKEICEIIKRKMFDMEKYSTSKDGNKMTYLIVPADHPRIPFPLNLEDRIATIINNINKDTRTSVKYEILKNETSGDFHDIKYVQYTLVFSGMEKYSTILKSYGAIEKDGTWQLILE